VPIFEEDPNVKETWDYPWYRDPPTPRIHNRPGNLGRGGMGGFGPFVTPRWQMSDKYKQPQKSNVTKKEEDENKIGYETDWKYPNWLIRMAQWRNF